MARVSFTVTTVTHDGEDYPTPEDSDPTNDHEIEYNDATVILVMENVSASTRTVVIQAAASFGDPPIPLVDRTITLLAGDKKVAGPFSRRLFNQVGDNSDLSVLVDVDGSAADVEFVALSVPIAVA